MVFRKVATAVIAASSMIGPAALAQQIKQAPNIKPVVKVPVPAGAFGDAASAVPEGRVTVRSPYVNSKLYLEATGDMVRNRILGTSELTVAPLNGETAGTLPVTHDLDTQAIVLQADLQAGTQYRFQIELFSASLDLDRRLANFVDPEVSVKLRSDNRTVLRSMDIPLKPSGKLSGNRQTYQTGVEIIDFTVRADASRKHALVIEVPMRALSRSDKGALSRPVGADRVRASSSIAVSSIIVDEL